MNINDFNQKQNIANDPDTLMLLEDVYKSLFPNSQVTRVNDKFQQQQGIDAVVYQSDTRWGIFVDEKIRDRSYSDILLEEYSNWEKKRPGWLLCNKRTDYLIYVKLALNEVYIFPYALLRKAFLDNISIWLKSYGRIFAQNNGYKTTNIPVPLEEIKNTLWSLMVRNLTNGVTPCQH